MPDAMKKMLKKDRASVMHMLSVYLACFATGAMALFFMGWLKNLHQREMLDMIARKNLLRMETCGYCSAEAMSGMEEELTAAGFENADFSGTTAESVGYGQEIYLSIRGTVKHSVLGTSGGSLSKKEVQEPFSMHLSSTAKH